MPYVLYICIAFFKLNISANNKLYIRSKNIIVIINIDNTTITFLFVFKDKYIPIGLRIYININDDNPNHKTLLKQTKNTILQKLNI